MVRLFRSLLLSSAALLGLFAVIGLGGLVTAAVTGEGWNAHAQGVGDYSVVVSLPDGAKFTWTSKTYPDQKSCDLAMGNAAAVLAYVGAPPSAPDAPGVKFAGVDEDLANDIVKLLTALYQRDHQLPNLQITCEIVGDPA